MLVNGEIIQNFIKKLESNLHHNVHLHLTQYTATLEP